MNSELKQKLEEAGKNYVASFGGEIPVSSKATKDNFVSGAQWLHDQGFQFTAEDMADFAEWFSANWDLDFKADEAMEQWLKERSKQK